jgi:hypothetical protein
MAGGRGYTSERLPAPAGWGSSLRGQNERMDTVTDDDDYVYELREVRRRRDTQRSKSSKSSEVESDLLRYRRNGKVAGPTESRAVDEDALRRRYQNDPISSPPAAPSHSPGAQALLDFVLDVVAEVGREVVLPFIEEVAIPAVQRKVADAAARRGSRPVRGVREVEEQPPSVKHHSASSLDEAVGRDLGLDESCLSISRSKQLRLQLQLKLAEDFAANRRHLLSRVEVVDNDAPPELEHAITLLIEGRVDELDDDTRERVAVLLDREGEAFALTHDASVWETGHEIGQLRAERD